MSQELEEQEMRSRYKYTMDVCRVWDGKFSNKEGSNNLEYFNKYKNKQNYRIVIRQGKKILYDERRNGECGRGA